MGQFDSKGGLAKLAPLKISREEIRKSIRVPLPSKTGGAHKTKNRRSRQEEKASLRKGDWQ